MKIGNRSFAASLAALLLWSTGPSLHAADPVLDLLVKKGVITPEEASKVQGTVDEGNAKVEISESWVDKIQLFGDIRWRYEVKESENAFDRNEDVSEVPGRGNRRRQKPNHDTLSRSRYRLRFGFRGDIGKQFQFGIRLVSGGEGIDGNNENLGDAFRYDPLTINWVYFKYTPADFVTFWLGKYDADKLIYTTDLIWDGDVTAEGSTQQWKLKTGDLHLFANTIQWVYSDAAEANRDLRKIGDGYNEIAQDDGWIFGGQVGAQYDFVPKKVFAKAAVGYWYYANSGDVIPADEPSGTSNVGDEFQLLDALAEFTYTVPGAKKTVDAKGVEHTTGGGFLAGVPITLYGHIVWNSAPAPNRGVIFQGDGDPIADGSDGDTNIENDRTVGERFGPGAPSGSWADLSDDLAWRVGLRVGKAKKQGDWEVNGFYEQVGSDAVPDLFNDSDIGNGFTNHKGWALKAKYMVKDWWEVGVSYLDADFLDPDIPQDFNQSYQAQGRTVQIDTVVKF